MAGVYIHIPFCGRKCTYCNFYSACTEKSVVKKYIQALCDEIKRWGGPKSRPVETVYIGGGTPSVLNGDIAPLIETVQNSFMLTKDCEITVEMNPEQYDGEFLYAAKQAEVNRISIGAQSGNDSELKMLGRCHTARHTRLCVEAARKAGFSNISLDIMIGLPNSNTNTLKESLTFLTSLCPEHISAYILKVEPQTALYNNKTLEFCSEEEQAEQYLYTCDYLKNAGYFQYEISNFAKKGFESRHNLKYWHCEEYLGIGAGAHSFLEGKRFFYPPDLKGFIACPQTVADGTGGDFEEYFMLALRLREGVDLSELERRFNVELTPEGSDFLRILVKQGLCEIKNNRISLTQNGMLVSNTIITEILERFT